MPKRLEEITATYQHERFRFENASGDVVVGDGVDDSGQRITIKATADGDEPARHFTYRWYGSWSTYRNKRTGQDEKQFHAKTFVRCEPHGRAGVISYLARAPKIGRVIAGRLYEKFGGDAVRIVRTQPDVAAAAVSRLSPAGAIEAAEWLDVEKALEDCTIAIIDLLDGRGFPKGVSKEAVKKWGNAAAEVIRQNPYRLMEFRGCGFKRADSLYLDLGLPPAALKRQALCAWHALAQRSSGDTWYYVDVVNKSLAGAIGGTEVNASRALRLAVRGRIVAMTYTDGIDGVPSWDGSHCWVAEERNARNERRLAAMIDAAQRETSEWPEIGEIKDQVSDHQAMQLDMALTGPIAVLGGSPGTGKTFTAAQLIKLLQGLYGSQQIGIAAPTGKAAVRLTESLSDHGVGLAAKTWHSLLKVESSEDGWSFVHNASNPLPFKVLIGDESSMLDTDLAASIFAARARGTLVLLIGDTNQLPPVGHGAPLRDMIRAGLPYGELREIRRNSGEIVQACAAIRDGKQFESSEREGNLIAVPCSSASGQRDAMISTIDRYREVDGINHIWDVQVLCAVNKKSELSRRDLNRQLQIHLNPSPPVNGSPFRIGDKVVNTKNGWFPSIGKMHPDAIVNDDDKVYVANGELGQVIDVQPKTMTVTLTSPQRMVLVPRGEASTRDDDDDDATGTGCNWDLGYALSVHKSQGSEWPIVIVMVDESAGAARVCSREWLYTAISRAKDCSYLIGKESVAQGFCRRTALDKRKTFLAEQIAEEQSRPHPNWFPEITKEAPERQSA